MGQVLPAKVVLKLSHESKLQVLQRKVHRIGGGSASWSCSSGLASAPAAGRGRPWRTRRSLRLLLKNDTSNGLFPFVSHKRLAQNKKGPDFFEWHKEQRRYGMVTNRMFGHFVNSPVCRPRFRQQLFHQPMNGSSKCDVAKWLARRRR